jgi:outer membrane protein assembly factor BamB
VSSSPIHLEVHGQSLKNAACEAAERTAVISAIFIAVVGIMMLMTVLREGPADSLPSAVGIDQMKRELIATPRDATKSTIREEDRRVRQTFFSRRAFLAHGAWLLLGGGIVLAVCVKVSRKLSAHVYLPTGAAPADPALGPSMTRALGAGAIVLASAMLLLHVLWRAPSVTPAKSNVPVARTPGPSATVPVPAKTELLPGDAWPGFRGPGGLGVATGAYPTNWDTSTGKNVLWKTRIPLPGHNSPVIVANCVFVSGGNSEKREVYCLDAIAGAILWARQVGAGAPPLPESAADAGWAPSTMAADGHRVFAIFPTGELVCLDKDGNEIWRHTLGPIKNIYAHCSSLLTFESLLFVQLDQGTARDGLSAMLAFDCATGKPMWKTLRRITASWSTPAILPAPSGPQLLALGDPWVIAYEPKTGREIWRAKGMSGEVVPSAAFAGGFAYAATEASQLVAFKVDGHGDITASGRKAIEADAMPDIVSPVAIGSRVLLVASGGSVGLVDASTGKQLWTQEFEDGFHASPVVAGNIAYLTDRKGVTHVIELGASFRELAKCPLGEAVDATAAYSGGRIYLRGQHDLFCIGSGEATKEASP